MRSKFILFVVMLLPVLLSAQGLTTKGNVYIKGTISNANADFVDYSISNYFRDDAGSFVIMDDGSFERILSVVNRQKLNVILDSFPLSFTVLSGDTIKIHWDNKDPYSTFTVQSSDKKRNLALTAELNINRYLGSKLSSIRKKITPSNNTYNPGQKIQFVNELYNETISAFFKDTAITSAYFESGMAQDYRTL